MFRDLKRMFVILIFILQGSWASDTINVTAREGDNVMFSVLTNSYLKPSSITAYCMKNSRVYNDITITNSEINSTTTIIWVTFCEVTREMSGLYNCYITGWLRSNDQIFNRQQNWHLNITYFPDASQLLCHGPNSTSIQEGDTALLRCVSIAGNPPVHLEWKIFPSVINISSLRIITESWIGGYIRIDRSFHLKVLYCVATSDFFPDASVSCSIGPFLVSYPPAVHLTPSNATMLLPVISELRMECLVDSFPVDVQYRWSSSPADVPIEFDSAGKGLAIIRLHRNFSPDRLNTKLAITCSVNNTVGVSQSTTSLQLVKIQSQDVPMCSSNTPILALERDENRFLFKCIWNKSNVFVRWYINGNMVKEKLGVHSISSELNSSSYRLENDSLPVLDGDIVACQASFSSGAQSTLFCKINYEYDRLSFAENKPTIIEGVETPTPFIKPGDNITRLDDISFKLWRSIAITSLSVNAIIVLTLLVLLFQRLKCLRTRKGNNELQVSTSSNKDSAVSNPDYETVPENFSSNDHPLPCLHTYNNLSSTHDPECEMRISQYLTSTPTN